MSYRIDCPSCPNKVCFVPRHCSAEWIKQIDIEKEQRTYKADQQIFREGDRVSGLYFIQRGKVKIVSNGILGKEQIVRLAADGYVIGHCAFNDETYPVGAVALEETVACFLSNNLLKKAYLENPTFTLAFMQYYSAELRKMEIRLKHLAQMSIQEKVAEALLHIFDIFGADPETHFLNVTLSRQELAELIGTNAEQVTRQLTIFHDENLIAKHGKNIRLVDAENLRKMVAQYERI